MYWYIGLYGPFTNNLSFWTCAMYFDCKVSAPRGGTTEKFSKLLPKNWDPHTLGSLNSGSNTTSNASNHQPSFPPDSCYPKAPIAARKKTKRIQKLWNVAINALFLAPTRFLMVASQCFWLGKFLGISFDVLLWEKNAPACAKLLSNSCNWKDSLRKCCWWCGNG